MPFSAQEVERLLSDVEWALAQGLAPKELVAMLQKLALRAPAASRPGLFARRQLAELSLPERPWRSARYAREALRVEEDARTWSVLGLAHTLLKNFRCARRAYFRALALDPHCPSTAHNLGHLLDVAFQNPTAALTYLRSARAALADETEVASSYAHALLRSGQPVEARRVLIEALGRARAEEVLERWLGRTRQK
jgi:tetratricopeptide (TPR) repeat protein